MGQPPFQDLLFKFQIGDLHQDNGHCNAADKSSHNRGGDKVYDPVCVEKVKQQEPGKDRHRKNEGYLVLVLSAKY